MKRKRDWSVKPYGESGYVVSGEVPLSVAVYPVKGDPDDSSYPDHWRLNANLNGLHLGHRVLTEEPTLTEVHAYRRELVQDIAQAMQDKRLQDVKDALTIKEEPSEWVWLKGCGCPVACAHASSVGWTLDEAWLEMYPDREQREGLQEQGVRAELMTMAKYRREVSHKMSLNYKCPHGGEDAR